LADFAGITYDEGVAENIFWGFAGGDEGLGLEDSHDLYRTIWGVGFWAYLFKADPVWRCLAGAFSEVDDAEADGTDIECFVMFEPGVKV